MLKLYDKQHTGALHGATFLNVAEVLEWLKNYHQDIENINEMDIDDILEIGDWELEEVAEEDKNIKLFDIDGNLVANLMFTAKPNGKNHLSVLYINSVCVEVEEVDYLI